MQNIQLNLPDVHEWNASALAQFEKVRSERPSISMEPLLEWIGRRGYYFGDPRGRGTTNCWGFGEVPIFAMDPDGAWWTALIALVEPTGIPFKRLHELYKEYVEEEDAWAQEAKERRTTDCLFGPDGFSYPLVNSTFAMKMFALHSPWAKEYYEKTSDLMFHAMKKTGLAGAMTRTKTGFTAKVQLTLADGEVIQVLTPIRGWTGGEDEVGVPLIHADDDSDDDDLIPVTDWSEVYEVITSADAAEALFSTSTTVEEAAARASAPFTPKI